MADGSAEHFSDSDFFDPEIGRIHHQSEQAHATDKNSESGRPLQQMGNILFALVKFCDAFIHECIVKIFFRKIFFKCFFYIRRYLLSRNPWCFAVSVQYVWKSCSAFLKKMPGALREHAGIPG